MSDDENDDAKRIKSESALAEYSRKVSVGEPIIGFWMEPPLKFGITLKGELVVDFPGLAAGGTDFAAMVRVTVPPAAISQLIQALQAAQKMLDEHGEAPPGLTSH